jgi:hypothetical protein
MSNKKWLKNESDPEDDEYELLILQCKPRCISRIKRKNTRVRGGSNKNTITINI